MPPTFDKELEKLDAERQTAREGLDKQEEKIRGHAVAAQSAAEQARRKIAELEAKRPALALAAVSGEDGADAERECLEGELADARRALELAGLAEGEAERRGAELAERRRAAEREATEKRYDAYAKERKERILKMESATDALVSRLWELATLTGDHDQVIRELTGQPPIGRPYGELLSDFLAARLGAYVRDGSSRVLAMGGKPIGSLLEVDLHLTPLAEQRRANEEQMRRSEEMAEASRRESEAYFRQQDFEYRRQQLRTLSGYSVEGMSAPQIRQEVDERVNRQLAAEGFGDLLEAEKLAAVEKRRGEIKAMLLGWLDHDEPTLEELAQIEARVAEQLRDEFGEPAGVSGASAG